MGQQNTVDFGYTGFPPWNFKRLICWLLGFLVFGFLLRFAFDLFFEHIHKQIESEQTLRELSMLLFMLKVSIYQFALFAFLFLRLRSFDISIASIFRFSSADLKYALLCLFIGAAMACLWVWASTGFRNWDYQFSIWATIFQLFFLALVAPVVEEIYFRGLLYRALRKIKKRETAILISAAIFVAYHIDYFFSPINMLFTLIFGILAAVFLERTSSLIASCLLHVALNTTIQLLHKFNPLKMIEALKSLVFQ